MRVWGGRRVALLRGWRTSLGRESQAFSFRLPSLELVRASRKDRSPTEVVELQFCASSIFRVRSRKFLDTKVKVKRKIQPSRGKAALEPEEYDCFELYTIFTIVEVTLLKVKMIKRCTVTILKTLFRLPHNFLKHPPHTHTLYSFLNF